MLVSLTGVMPVAMPLLGLQRRLVLAGVGPAAHACLACAML